MQNLQTNDHYLGNVNVKRDGVKHQFTEDEVKEEIDFYDENLYEVLLPYVLNEEDSWEIMQEFKSDRAMLDFLNRGDD